MPLDAKGGGLMVAVRREYVDGPFGQIHIRVAGKPSDKPALLCFHMSPMSGRIYANFIAQMGEDRLAVAVDTPGFGMSDTPEELPEIEDYARAMVAVIDALGIGERVDIMGYHTGSHICVEVARLRPEQVRRIIFVSADVLTEEERAEMRDRYKPVVPSLDGEHLMKRWRSYIYHNLGHGLDLEMVADMFPDGLLGRNRAWYGHRAAFNHRFDTTLPEVPQPIMVINPDDDLKGYTPRVAGLMINGLIVDKPEWGHGFLDASTADATDLARSFLDSKEPFDERPGRYFVPVFGSK